MTSNLKINHLDVDAKKTMKLRVISSIVVILYFSFIFLFGVLSSAQWSPIQNNLAAKISFMSLLMILPIALIAIIAHEVRNLYFKANKVAYASIFIFSFLAVYSSILVFVPWCFDIKYPTIISGLNPAITLMSILLIVWITLTFVFCATLLHIYKILSIKNFLIFSTIIIVTMLALVGLLYVLIKREWTTLLYLLIIPIMMDSFAYFGGTLFGKHKMFEKISPKKTWEGFLIALLVTIVLISLLFFALSYINKPVLNNIIPLENLKDIENNPLLNNALRADIKWWAIFLITTLILAIVSMIGDLVFSMFKRAYNLKDYGNLIPGHGGLLDRIDSHVFVITIYFLLSGFIGLIASF